MHWGSFILGALATLGVVAGCVVAVVAWALQDFNRIIPLG